MRVKAEFHRATEGKNLFIILFIYIILLQTEVRIARARKRNTLALVFVMEKMISKRIVSSDWDKGL